MLLTILTRCFRAMAIMCKENAGDNPTEMQWQKSTLEVTLFGESSMPYPIPIEVDGSSAHLELGDESAPRRQLF